MRWGVIGGEVIGGRGDRWGGGIVGGRGDRLGMFGRKCLAGRL